MTGSYLRNIHEYYPYGLEYWRSGSQLYDKGDQLTEFHHREWEIDGIEMNRFAARWYDPIQQFLTAAQRRFRNANPDAIGTIARWHSPDPLEQMHSPYVALCNDPANFVDPDGRAGIHLSDWDKENLIGFASVMAGGAAMAGIGQALQGASGIGQAFQTIRGVLSAVSTISSGVSLMQSISSMSKGFGIGNQMSSAWQDDLLHEVNSHGHTGLAFRGAGIGGPSEILWSRVTRSDGSFMGNLIWMDGETGLQNGNNVDMFLYYSMRTLQLEHKVEISGFLIFDEKNHRYGYFIQDWKGPGNTRDNSYDIPEITTVSRGSLLLMNGIQYKIFASFHTHPDKGANDPDLGGPEDFDNAPSTEDGFYAANRKAPCYVLGTDFISRVRGIEAGEIELNTREKNEYGKTVKWNSDYYKIADITEINMGKFTIIGDQLNKYRKIKGKK
ncbi:MAG: hypothetical protein K1X54_11050 [Flavobacteriales bacterium]|nr:hypothetical protein [Flavobacteriales bacterium]